MRLRFFFMIVALIPTLTLLWWVWADYRLRGVPRSRWWRGGITAFCAVFFLAYLWTFSDRFTQADTSPHAWAVAFLLMWGMIFLPFLAVPSMGAWSLWWMVDSVVQKLRHRRGSTEGAVAASPPKTPSVSAKVSTEGNWTRRQVVTAGLVALPAIATLGATGLSIPQKQRFRLRRLVITMPQLPEALHGMTIAHISDTHVGKFTSSRMLRRMAEVTNSLEADLIMLTGDLIDRNLADLPDALAMIDRIDPRHGVFLCEGNHDLFMSRQMFHDRIRSHGVPLLANRTATVRVHGHPVQVLGLPWQRRGVPIEDDIDAVAQQRDPDAFGILLAHHPHAFDRAAERGIPLTLSGHTHGGQFMLTPEIGLGPAIFRYWSGLYQQGDSRLVVSNGTGNWFPLRTSAPAEILHLTLRRP